MPIERNGNPLSSALPDRNIEIDRVEVNGIVVYQSSLPVISTISRPADSVTDTGQVNWNGITVEPSRPIAGFRVDVSSNTSELERVGLQTHLQGGTDWIVQESVGKVASGGEIEVVIPNESDYLQAGTQYDLLLDNGGDEYTRGAYEASGQYPYTSPGFDITTGMYSTGASTSSRFYSITNITPIVDPTYGASVTRAGDNRVGSGQTNWCGVTVEPKTEIAGFRVRVSEGTTPLERVGIQTHQQGGTDWIAQESYGEIGPGDEVEIVIPDSSNYLQAGTQYDILLDNGGNSYTRGAYQDSAQYPYQTDDYDLTTGMYSSGSASGSNFYNIDRVKAITSP